LKLARFEHRDGLVGADGRMTAAGRLVCSRVVHVGPFYASMRPLDEVKGWWVATSLSDIDGNYWVMTLFQDAHATTHTVHQCRCAQSARLGDGRIYDRTKLAISIVLVGSYPA